MLEFYSVRMENEGKRENADYCHFHCFPQSFQKKITHPDQNVLTFSQASPGFFTFLLLKTLGKGEIAHNEQFLLFPQCLLLGWRTFCYFHQI